MSIVRVKVTLTSGAFENLMRKRNQNKFNVFHVRALYYTKNFKHQQMHKEFFIVNYNTLLHVSTQQGRNL
jgi:hypothetical protein